jgi:NADP-dependent 3-hydroxy acid dehydrogenase YdfG
MAANASERAARKTSMTGRLVGKPAVISGRAAGLGRVTSLLFAKEGARVAIIDLQFKLIV